MLDATCPFCRLIQGRAPAQVVYEDDQTFAFLDRAPINPGHVLVIPKAHVPDFYRLADDAYGRLMATVKRVAQGVEALTHPRKVGLVIAGFDVPHTHVHVVPMHDYHDITSQAYLARERVAPSGAELAGVAARLRRTLVEGPER